MIGLLLLLQFACFFYNNIQRLSILRVSGDYFNKSIPRTIFTIIIFDNTVVSSITNIIM